jgi:hypothetical protein
LRSLLVLALALLAAACQEREHDGAREERSPIVLPVLQ